MPQTIDEILKELQSFVAGRGREDNFCYSKVYSPSSYIRCIDFSPWVGKRLVMGDTFALAVFQAKLSGGSSFGVSITFPRSDNGEVNVDEFNDDQDITTSFDNEVERHEKEIEKILQFPFEEYFTGEIKSAKLDLIISWLLNYPYSQLARILMAYNLFLNNVHSYFESYNSIKKTQMEVPSDLPNTIKLSEFQKEFRKLPLATRLHLFDVLEYSGFSKKPKLRLLSDMTLYDSRKVGIDEHESANILRQSKLITSFSDGTGSINPEYIEAVSAAVGYAIKIAPAYHEWESEVSDKLSGCY